MSQYPYHIEYHMLEHHGVSATRNEALRRSNAEYVSFIDCDDRIALACGIFTIFREINNRKFNVMISSFYEQTKDANGDWVFITHSLNEQTFVHGRVYRRQYLIDNDIKFPEGARVHEDSCHTITAQALSEPDKVLFNPTPWHCWVYRDSSVCRRDPLYIKKTYIEMLASSDELVNGFIKRMRDDLATQYICFMVMDTYYTLLSKSWRDNINAEYREMTEKRFAEYLYKHLERYQGATNEMKLAVSNGVRQRHVMEGDMMLEDITIDAYIQRVLDKYPAT
jgi:glycosyltransferase involved in cell wall biosynthesis